MSDAFDPYRDLSRTDPSANLNLTPLQPADAIAPAPQLLAPQPVQSPLAQLDEMLAPAPVIPERGQGASPLLPIPAGGDQQLAQANAATRVPVRAVNTMADWFRDRSPFASQSTTTPFDPQRQAHLASAVNKLAEMKDLYDALPAEQRQTLIGIDQDRITKGAAPLSKPDTAALIRMMLTGEGTKPKKRDLNPIANIGRDMKELFGVLNPFHTFPALWNEVWQVGKLFATGRNEDYYKQRAQGVNPFTALTRSPGIRLIPGAYTAGNLADGKQGLREVATHPLMTLLDVIPAASRASALTSTGRAGAEIAEAAGRRLHTTPTLRGIERTNPRAIRDVLMNRPVRNPDGTIARQFQETLPEHVPEAARDIFHKGWRVEPTEAQLAKNPAGLPIMERTAFGKLWDSHVMDTGVGRFAQRLGAPGARKLARLMAAPSIRARGIAAGKIIPEPPGAGATPMEVGMYQAEQLAYDTGAFTRKVAEHADELPDWFTEGYLFPESGALNPAQEAAHADLLRRVEMDDGLNQLPEWVQRDYTDLMERAAKQSPDDLAFYQFIEGRDPEVLPIAQYNKLRRGDQTLASREALYDIYNEGVLKPQGDHTIMSGWIDQAASRAADQLSPRILGNEMRLIGHALEQSGIDITTPVTRPVRGAKGTLAEAAKTVADTPKSDQGALHAARQVWAKRANAMLERHLDSMETHTGVRALATEDVPLPSTLKVTTANLRDLRRLATNKATNIPLPTKFSLVDNLAKVIKGISDPSIKGLSAARRRVAEIVAKHSDELRDAASRSKREHADLDKVIGDMVNAHSRAKAMSRVARQNLVPSEARLAQFRETVESRRRHTAPARYHPLIQHESRLRASGEIARLIDTYRTHPDPSSLTGPLDRRIKDFSEVTLPSRLTTQTSAFGPEVAEMQRRLSSGELGALNVTPDEIAHLTIGIMEGRWGAETLGFPHEFVRSIIRQTEREVAGTWMDLQAKGLEPWFVHRVTPNRAQEAFHPAADPVPELPSQAKERSIDVSPRVNDVQIAITHQAAELLQRQMQLKMVDMIAEGAGVDQAALIDRYRDYADFAYSEHKHLNFEAWVQNTLKGAWAKLDPEQAGFSWGGSKLDKYSTGQVWIPKYMMENLKDYVADRGPMFRGLTAATNVFKMNVIGLSPSVTLNNAVNNFVTIAAKDPRALLQLPKAWRAMRQMQDAPPELAVVLLQEFHAMPNMGKHWLSTKVGRVFARSKFMAAFNARHAWAKSVTDRLNAQHGSLNPAVRAAKVVEGLSNANSKLMVMGDNVSKGMVFFHNLEKELKAGRARPEAINAALRETHETIINYMEFTPLERAAMSTIIPFYSYASFAARFVSRYALDHPVRTAILAATARVIQDDIANQPGSRYSFIPLPDWLPFAQRGPDGSKNFLSTRPFDPFSGVADIASFAGWFGAMNPVITASLEAGTGMKMGEQDLFPTMEYNESTGRLEAVRDGSIVSIFAGNLVPRFQQLGTPLGLNAKYNRLRDTKGEGSQAAATRSLATGFGIPLLWRRMNEDRMEASTELNRLKSQREAINRALRTGDWSDASLYPGAASARAQAEYLSQNHGDALGVLYGQDQDPEVIRQLLTAVLAGD